MEKRAWGWWSFRLAAFLLAGAAAFFLAVLTILLNWPFTEAKVIKTLEARSGRKVTIQSFQSTYFPPGMKAENVQFLRIDHPDREPLIVIKQVVVKTNWGLLLTFGQRVPRADVYGMHLTVPSSAPSKDGKEHTLIPGTSAKGGSNLQFGKIVLHDALVDFLPAKAGVETFRIPIREISLSRVASNQPFGFDAVVENAIPKGEVREKGTLGPWDSENPSNTPIAGTFTYRNGQMRDIPGLSGTMQVDGNYQGTLARIEVKGSAAIPDFRVLRSSHTENLRSTYQASVDATNGDVELHGIDVEFGRTTVHAKGRVMNKLATLQAQVRGGRMEDLEQLVMLAKVVPLNGSISLDTSIRLPPGLQPFLARLEMAGKFKATGETFTNAKTQNALNQLAKSAKVESAMTANVTVKGGMARVSQLMLTCPATAVRMDGTLNLLSKDVDLKGTLKTDGKLSDTQSGFKAFAIQMITPFLKKHDSTVLAFEVKGKYGDLHPEMKLGGKRRL